MSLSRFKGTLVGAVVADCIGAEFEGLRTVKVSKVLELYDKLTEWRQQQRQKGSRPADVYGIEYTDDTAMTRCIMDSLLEYNKLDVVDLAKRFAKEYYKAPNRGYGSNVVAVFERLNDPDLKDVFEPAKQQFDGSGSYGNGGAMRIAPVPLFLYQNNDLSKLEEMTSSVTRLTHTHPHAIIGALLQAFAVDLSLRLPQTSDVDADAFCNELITRLKPFEEKFNLDSQPPKKKRQLDDEPYPYCAKLERIKDFVKEESLPPETVEKVLGNDVSALGSVPTAVLSFLRGAAKGVPSVEEANPFRRIVTYAISLGGDTDTIATMAAAMAGAFYGQEIIPEEWQYYCEGVKDAEEAGEKFYLLVNAHTDGSVPSTDKKQDNPFG